MLPYEERHGPRTLASAGLRSLKSKRPQKSVLIGETRQGRDQGASRCRSGRGRAEGREAVDTGSKLQPIAGNLVGFYPHHQLSFELSLPNFPSRTTSSSGPFLCDLLLKPLVPSNPIAPSLRRRVLLSLTNRSVRSQPQTHCFARNRFPVIYPIKVTLLLISPTLEPSRVSGTFLCQVGFAVSVLPRFRGSVFGAL